MAPETDNDPISMPEEHVGTVTHFYDKIHVASVKLDKSVRQGEVWHVKGAHDNTTFKVRSMQEDHKTVDGAGRGHEVGVEVPSDAKLHEGSEVLRVTQR